MPYRSQKQSAYIHAMANRGVGWAVKWVAENHGQKVHNLPTYTNRKVKHRA